MANTPTPHIGAQYGQIAPTVLMAGDPLRAKFMAENYLKDPVLFNNVRGMLGYTGSEAIIRVGSAGANDPELKLGDIVIAQGACTDSNYGAQFGLPGSFAPIADFTLLRKAVECCERRGLRFKVGNILSSDTFYSDNPQSESWRKMGVLAVEMEAAALYMNAARAGRRALTICTISDHLLTGEVLDAEARRTTFTGMMEVALSLI